MSRAPMTWPRAELEVARYLGEIEHLTQRFVHATHFETIARSARIFGGVQKALEADTVNIRHQFQIEDEPAETSFCDCFKACAKDVGVGLNQGSSGRDNCDRPLSVFLNLHGFLTPRRLGLEW